MKAVIQRVLEASVEVDSTVISSIKHGLLLLIGVQEGDTDADADYLIQKISQLRIFADENGLMNLNITQVGGQILAVSQFTLCASTKKGNRPSFISAAKPDIARPMFDEFCIKLGQSCQLQVYKGIFGADMKVKLINDGPVTLLIDSRNKE